MDNIEVVPYNAKHFESIIPQQAQQYLEEKGGISFTDYMRQLPNGGPTYCVMLGDKCLATGGIIPMHTKRAIVWILLDEKAGRHMPFIHKKVSKFLDDAAKKYKRLEMTVSVNFAQGHRWAEHLGFTPDGLHQCYDPNGDDHIGYERITK